MQDVVEKLLEKFSQLESISDKQAVIIKSDLMFIAQRIHEAKDPMAFITALCNSNINFSHPLIMQNINSSTAKVLRRGVSFTQYQSIKSARRFV